MESKRSCCSPVTCCGMPIEKGCYIFSVINAILCSLLSLCSLGFLVYVIQMWLNAKSMEDSVMDVLCWNAFISMVYIAGSGSALIFAVFLWLGLRKNKPQYIMAYMVFGITTLVLSVGGIVAFVWMQWENTPLIMFVPIPVGACVIYSALLLLVYQTHAVLTSSTPVTGHRRLTSKDC